MPHAIPLRAVDAVTPVQNWETLLRRKQGSNQCGNWNDAFSWRAVVRVSKQSMKCLLSFLSVFQSKYEGRTDRPTDEQTHPVIER